MGGKAILSDSSACGRIEKEKLPQREQSGTEVLIMDDYQKRVLECALEYIKLGWKVIPLHTIRDGRCDCGNPNCGSPGKHPIANHGSTDASGDEADIRRWFGNGITFNIGIATGSASGLVVLDIDPRHGGDESIKQFNIPPTLEVITGSGGRHFYFMLPEDGQIRNAAGKIAAGMDVRGENGYVVAPPSLHLSGQSYRWAIDPKDVRPVPWPEQLNIPMGQVVNCKSLGDRLENKKTDASDLEGQIITKGQRNEQLTSIAMALRRQGCNQEAFFEALININQRRCKPPLGYVELKKIAVSIAQYQPQPQDGSVLSAIAFVRERCQIGGDRKTRSQELYDAYKRWCKEAGMSHLGRNRFYEEFGRAFPDCARSKVRQGNSGTSPVWVYENIALLAEYRTAGF